MIKDLMRQEEELDAVSIFLSKGRRGRYAASDRLSLINYLSLLPPPPPPSSPAALFAHRRYAVYQACI